MRVVKMLQMSHPTTHSYLDKYFAAFDEDAAQADIDQVAAEVDEKQAAFDLAEAELRHARDLLESKRAGLEAWRAWKAATTGTTTAPVEPAIENGDSPTSRRSLAALIGSHPGDHEWTIPSVADALGLGHDAHHAIGVSLSRMARAGEIFRRRKGVYTKLPPEPVRGDEGGNREVRLAPGSQFGTG